MDQTDRSRSFALAVLCGVLFVTFLDNTIVSVTLADIQGDLHAGVQTLQWVVNGYALTLATMGPGMPYAFGAKMGHPDRPVIALVGDDAMQMNGINELITVSKYWQGWADPRLVVLVVHNNDLNQVTWERRAMAGDPKFEVSQTVLEFPYVDYARSLGLAVADRRSRRRRCRLGRGLRRRPPVRPRCHLRSRGSAAAAARRAGPGPVLVEGGHGRR